MTEQPPSAPPPLEHNWQESTDTCVVCFWNSNEPHCPKVCPGVPKWHTERSAPEGSQRANHGSVSPAIWLSLAFSGIVIAAGLIGAYFVYWRKK